MVKKDSQINVLWLIKGLGAGGAERLLVDALPYIDRRRFNYEVAYMLPAKNDFSEALKSAGVNVHCLNMKGGYDVGVVIRLRRLLNERKISVIHSHLPFAGIMARIVAKFTEVDAVVYTEHSVLSVYNPLISLANRLTYRLDDATIAVSDQVHRSASSWPVFHPKRIQTIVNGISIDDIQPDRGSRDSLLESLGIPSNHFVVGNVAHVRPEKGQIYLIEAMAKVIAARRDVSCVFVGREKIPGSLVALENRAAELGIQDRVVFTGFRDDARQLLNAFDAFALTSLVEGLPIALLEAMALGLPSVATAVGGVPEVIENGVDGFLVPRKDVDAIADRILKLVDDSNLRRSFSLAAKKKVASRFTIGRVIEATEAIYTRVLQDKGTMIAPTYGQLDIVE